MQGLELLQLAEYGQLTNAHELLVDQMASGTNRANRASCKSPV